MKWFGQSWGAPLCRDLEHIPTPAGLLCVHCEEPIDWADQGIVDSNGPVAHDSASCP